MRYARAFNERELQSGRNKSFSERKNQGKPDKNHYSEYCLQFMVVVG